MCACVCVCVCACVCACACKRERESASARASVLVGSQMCASMILLLAKNNVGVTQRYAHSAQKVQNSESGKKSHCLEPDSSIRIRIKTWCSWYIF